jgi:uncharacterized protein YutE (UPF0331/DUF86 family)/predicted nucleotidyltransferase
MDRDNLTERLREYFKRRNDISFAYLFGSVAKGTSHNESDVDIGVYFKPETNALEYEAAVEYDGEDALWSDIEHITKRQTDMVVLNRAPATLFDGVFRTGILLYEDGSGLRTRLFLAITDAAEEFRDFVVDFYNIKERSHSLNEIDRERLGRMVSFLEQERLEYAKFQKVSQMEYQTDRDVKRSFERWSENIVNVSIDMAKILLASEKRAIPETYKAILEGLMVLPGFGEDMAKSLSQFSKMRNLLAHEYLDIRFSMLKKFVNESEQTYMHLIKFAKGILGIAQ